MSYSIGQISKMFHLPISTLRYYDKQGLFRTLERSSGIRVFTDNEIEALRVIDCLKQSGLEIKDIQTFMDLCEQGSSTYGQRLALFERQMEKVNQQMENLRRAQAMIQFKQWYYTTACERGEEESVKAMIPDQLPLEIYAAWQLSHAGLDTPSGC